MPRIQHLSLALLALPLLAQGCAAPYASYGDDDDDSSANEPPPLAMPPEDVEEPDVCDASVEDSVTWFMSADDSNSQAEPARIREQLRSGQTPTGGHRLYEFLNYYDFDFAPAQPGQVRLEPQLRAREGEPGAYDLLVAVVAPEQRMDQRRPLNLVFSIDSSCSMSGHPMEMAQASMEAVASVLDEGDVVSVLSWDSMATVLLDQHAVSGPDDRRFLRAINQLNTNGSTNFELGLREAYRLAEASFSEERLNRVFLVSDGGANTGITAQDLIAEHAEDGEEEAIYMVGIGASNGWYADDLMDQVTDLGKGAYLYIDSAEEAQRQLGTERMLSNLEIAAMDVRLELTLPPGFVIEEFHGEELSQNEEEVKPQHLAPNDQMLYHQIIRDCSADGGSDKLGIGFAVTWTDIEDRSEQRIELSHGIGELLDAPAEQLIKANAIVAVAQSLHGATTAAEARAALDLALDAEPSDPDLLEVERFLDAAR